jgi:hypothetical protein
MNNMESQFKNFLLFVHKSFRDDYDIQMNKNYTNQTVALHPLDGETTEERLTNVYNRIKLNTERLQGLIEDLDKRLGKKKKGDE